MTAPLVAITDRPYQLLPPLTLEQRDLLRQSIKQNGVLEPVVFDEDGEILDGHHRVEIAEELGIEYPRRVIDDLDRPGKHMYALTVNVARRQLDQATRGGLVAQMRIRGMSIREIAEVTGLSKTTVARDLAQVSQVGHLPEKVTGADGKTYAATRPAPQPTQTPEPAHVPVGSGPTPGPVGAAPNPPADPGATSPAPETPAPAVDAPAPREPDPEPTPPPGSPATWTDEQREANQREIDRKRMVADGRTAARILVMSMRAEITTVVKAVDLGEKNLINQQMIADLRAAVDLLESRLEASK